MQTLVLLATFGMACGTVSAPTDCEDGDPSLPNGHCITFEGQVAHRSSIESVVRQVMDDVNALLPVTDTRIVVRNRPIDAIPEIGMGAGRWRVIP